MGRRRGRALSFLEDNREEVARGARAVVVCPEIRGKGADIDPLARMEEARGLALAIGLEVVEAFAIPIREVRPGTLFGEGQIQRIGTECQLNEAELVIVDAHCRPSSSVISKTSSSAR